MSYFGEIPVGPRTIFVVEGATPKSIFTYTAVSFERAPDGLVRAFVKHVEDEWRDRHIPESSFRLTKAEAIALAEARLIEIRDGYLGKISALNKRIANVGKLRTIDRTQISG